MPPRPSRCKRRNSPSTCPVQSTSSEALKGACAGVALGRSEGWIALSIASRSCLGRLRLTVGSVAPKRFGELHSAARGVGVGGKEILPVGGECHGGDLAL